MSAKRKSKSKELPPIQDYPDSPLPAWKHYDIVHFAENKIQEELNKQDYSGYLIGLSVGYTLVNQEKTFEMVFGNVLPNTSQEYPDAKNPLSNKFLLELHNTITALLHQNMPEEFSDIDVELRVNVSGSFLLSIVVCRIVQAGECSDGHTDRRKCIQFMGNWTCLHEAC